MIKTIDFIHGDKPKKGEEDKRKTYAVAVLTAKQQRQLFHGSSIAFGDDPTANTTIEERNQFLKTAWLALDFAQIPQNDLPKRQADQYVLAVDLLSFYLKDESEKKD